MFREIRFRAWRRVPDVGCSSQPRRVGRCMASAVADWRSRVGHCELIAQSCVTGDMPARDTAVQQARSARQPDALPRCRRDRSEQRRRAETSAEAGQSVGRERVRLRSQRQPERQSAAGGVLPPAMATKSKIPAGVRLRRSAREADGEVGGHGEVRSELGGGGRGGSRSDAADTYQADSRGCGPGAGSGDGHGSDEPVGDRAGEGELHSAG